MFVLPSALISRLSDSKSQRKSVLSSCTGMHSLSPSTEATATIWIVPFPLLSWTPCHVQARPSVNAIFLTSP